MSRVASAAKACVASVGMPHVAMPRMTNVATPCVANITGMRAFIFIFYIGHTDIM